MLKVSVDVSLFVSRIHASSVMKCAQRLAQTTSPTKVKVLFESILCCVTLVAYLRNQCT